ncbi:extracellular solute-binding protein [Kordiimonas pumila]|uniref:Extracellular solute-binding protein n=1 Tax=Kordiimonas pumila TaxID=2161677 RepID=A0ABV7D0U0_9PROT|nr:extracellular solute-binding protein [Kordiimonas pumila]
MKFSKILLASFFIAGLQPASAGDAITVNWYHGKEFLYPVVQAFTHDTGIKVTVTNSDDAFDTDVMFVPDFSTLERVENEQFSNIQSPERDARVPVQWRDEKGLWYGVVVRLRGIAYNADKISADKLTSVYGLMDPALKGRICLLEGSYKSNRSFLATLIVEDGEEKARAWAKAVRENAETKRVYDNDMDNISHIANGECDVALLDNYYYHYMREGKRTSKYNIPDSYTEQMPELTSKVSVIWPEQATRGTAANVTAVAVSKTTENREAALKFVDFILSDKGQELMAENVFKYPVVPGVEWPQRLKDMGRPKISDLNLNKLRGKIQIADKIYSETGWE